MESIFADLAPRKFEEKSGEVEFKSIFSDLEPEIVEPIQSKPFFRVSEPTKKVYNPEANQFPDIEGVSPEQESRDSTVNALLNNIANVAKSMKAASIGGLTAAGQIAGPWLNTPRGDKEVFDAAVNAGWAKADATIKNLEKMSESFHKKHIKTPKAKSISKVIEASMKPFEWAASGTAGLAELGVQLGKTYKDKKSLTLDDVDKALRIANDVIQGKDAGSTILTPIAHTIGSTAGFIAVPKIAHKGVKTAFNKVLKETKIVDNFVEREISPETAYKGMIEKGTNEQLAAFIANEVKTRGAKAKIKFSGKVEQDRPFTKKFKESLGLESKVKVLEEPKVTGKEFKLGEKKKQIELKKGKEKVTPKEVVKEMESEISLEPGKGIEQVKKAKKKAEKKITPLKDKSVQKYIDKKVTELGSIEKVKAVYTGEKSDVNTYAREKAEELFGGDADVDAVRVEVKQEKPGKFEIIGKGFDTQKGKIVPFKKKWQAKKDMEVVARKAGLDVTGFKVFEQDGGWVFQRAESKWDGGKEFGERIESKEVVKNKEPELKSFNVEKEFGSSKGLSKTEESKIIEDYVDKKYGRRSTDVGEPVLVGKKGFKKGAFVPWKLERFADLELKKREEKTGTKWEKVPVKGEKWAIKDTGKRVTFKERSKIDHEAGKEKEIKVEKPLAQVGKKGSKSGKPVPWKNKYYADKKQIELGEKFEVVEIPDGYIVQEIIKKSKDKELTPEAKEFQKKVDRVKTQLEGEGIPVQGQWKSKPKKSKIVALDYEPTGIYNKTSSMIFKPTYDEITKRINPLTLHFEGSVSDLVQLINNTNATKVSPTDIKGMYKGILQKGYNELQFIEVKNGEIYPKSPVIDLSSYADKPSDIGIPEEVKPGKKIEKKVEEVKKPTSKSVSQGTGKVAALTDITAQKKRDLKDALGWDPVRTVVGELLQNSFDAMRGVTTKPLEIYIGDGVLKVTDYGKGMSPQIATDDLVTISKQGTKGEEDMGGFGFAKLPIMGWPDKFDITTIGRDEVTGVMTRSRIWGTKEEYMLENEVNTEITAVPENTPTGTIVTLKRESGITKSSVEQEVKKYGTNLRTGQTVKVVTDSNKLLVYDEAAIEKAENKLFKLKKDQREYRINKFIEQGDLSMKDFDKLYEKSAKYKQFKIQEKTLNDKINELLKGEKPELAVEEIKSENWKDVDSKFKMKKFEFNGSTVEIKYPKSPMYGYSINGNYSLDVKVFNKGLLLPDIPNYSSLNFSLPKIPNFKVEINFTKTPSATDIDKYPFLVNRTRLNKEIEQRVKKEVNETLVNLKAEIAEKTKKDLVRLFDGAPEFKGIKFITPLKEDSLIKNSHDVLFKHKDMLEDLSDLASDFNYMLDVHTDIPTHEFAITTFKGVHGFRPQSGLLDKDYIVVNPFTYLEKTLEQTVKGKISSKGLSETHLRNAATGLVDTFIHEAAHTNVGTHQLQFVQELHRLFRLLSHKRLHKMEDKAYEFFKKHQQDVERVTASLKHIQESGTLSPVFSEHVPEQRVKLTSKEKVGTDVKRHGQVRSGEGGVTLTSGFDPIQSVKAIGSLLKDGKDFTVELRKLGESFFKGGKQRYFDWQKKMKKVLGELWEKVKNKIQEIWKGLKRPVSNKRGSVPVPLKTTSKVKKSLKRTGKMVDHYLGAISTRLENIHPSIKNKMLEFELDSNVKIEKITKIVLPFIKKTKKMSKKDYKEFDLARKNGNQEVIDKFSEKYGLQKEMKTLRNLLDVLREEALAVGYKSKYVKGYHPREPKDIEGLADYLHKQDDWSTVDLFIKKKEKKLGRELTHKEKVKIVNSLFRGYADERITLSKPGQLKLRKIKKITPEINEFYADSNSALLRYITDMVTAIEAKKLFGSYKSKDTTFELEDTIGEYVLDLVEKKKISPSQERELRSILKARFSAVGTKGIVTTFKNLTYIDVMGSPMSAVTQLGDIAWSLYENGIILTGKNTAKAIIGKSKHTKSDLGISKIGAEFSDKTTSAKMVDMVFKLTGLTKVDAVGKEALINSSYEKAVQRARGNDKTVEKFRKELQPIYGKITENLIMDFKLKRQSRNVNLYLLHKLSAYQPITMSELPQGYLEGGNFRVLYMLKSFDIKKFDVYRREIFQQITKKKSRLKGIRNLIKLAMFLTMMEASADVIKDLMMGRKVDISDTVMKNMAELVVSKFRRRRMQTEGVGTGLGQQIVPPFQFINSLGKDVASAGDGKGMELTKSIPLLGKLYYENYGKGAKKREEKESNTNSIRRVKVKQIKTPRVKVKKVKVKKIRR